MNAEKKPPNGTTLSTVLQMLWMMPARSPGLTRAEFERELSITSGMFYRTLKVIQQAGVKVNCEFTPQGKKGFYITSKNRRNIDAIFGRE